MTEQVKTEKIKVGDWVVTRIPSLHGTMRVCGQVKRLMAGDMVEIKTQGHGYTTQPVNLVNVRP